MRKIAIFALLASTSLWAQEVETTDLKALTDLQVGVEQLEKALDQKPETQALAQPWHEVVRITETLLQDHPVGSAKAALTEAYGKTLVPAIGDAKRIMYAEKALCYQPAIRPYYHAVRLHFRRTNRALVGDATPNSYGSSQ